MTRKVSSLLAVFVLIIATTIRAASLFVVEWSDRPRDPSFAANAVFQRSLTCWTSGSQEVCELTVITIGRTFCPAVLQATSYRTDTGDLRISRTETSVDLDFGGASLSGPTRWKLHLKLRQLPGQSPIVEHASGVAVTEAQLPGDRVRSTELIALVSGTKGLASREFVEIDLKCPKIAVVAAKAAQ